MKNGFKPAGGAKWQVWAGMSLAFAALGTSVLLNSSSPPFTGRWSWLKALLHAHLGPQGITIFAFAVAIAFLIFSLGARRQPDR